MKTDELKLRLVKNADILIDEYFGEQTFVERITNSTLKAVVKININKIDGFLGLFADETGEIDAEKIIDTYAEQFGGEGIKLDIRDFVNDSFIRNLLPNKALLIKKEDIMSIIK